MYAKNILKKEDEGRNQGPWVLGDRSKKVVLVTRHAEDFLRLKLRGSHVQGNNSPDVAQIVSIIGDSKHVEG